MKLSECKIGDIITDGNRTLEFTCKKAIPGYSVIQYYFRIKESQYINEFKNMLLIYSGDNNGWVLVNRPNSEKEILEKLIHEKENELSELKKQYDKATIHEKLKEKNCYKINDELVYIDSIHDFYFKYFKIPQESNIPYTLTFSSVNSIEEVPELTISYNKFLEEYKKVT